MTQTRMKISNKDWKKINSALNQVQDNGRDIRQIFQSYYEEGEEEEDWEQEEEEEAGGFEGLGSLFG